MFDKRFQEAELLKHVVKAEILEKYNDVFFEKKK
jgi:hypothetical protein